MSRRNKKSEEKLTRAQIARALARVAMTTYRASPLAVVLKLIGALIMALVPLAAAYFAGLATTALAASFGGDMGAQHRVIWYIVAAAGLGMLTAIWSSLQAYVNELTSYKINAAVSDQLYEHFINLEYWRYDDKETADLFDKAQNFSLFFSRFFDTIAGILSAIVQITASLIALVVTHWVIGVMVVVAVVPGAIIQLKLSRLQSEHWRRMTEVRRKSNGITYNVFQPDNLAELRVYNAASAMLRLRAKYRDLDALDRIGFERKYMKKRLVADLFQAGVELGSLVMIATQIMQRLQPIGQFVYVQQLISRAFSSMQSMVSEVSGIDQDLATMFDYEKFMQLPRVAGGEAKLTSVPQQITINHVGFSYPGTSRDVLRDVSMHIERGEHVAIVGENGAGKSTLVKLLMGLYRPTAGTVEVDGKNLDQYDESAWRRNLGVLQQNFLRYFFTSVKDNVIFGDIESAYNPKQYKKALQDAEATAFVEKLPKKDETIPNRWYEDEDGANGVELSGGQWQRLALARNFYRDAPIIILDEPTSAIDALAESRIFKHLFSLKDKTIIAVSHRLTTVRKADRIYMMKDGAVVESGTCDELIAQKGEFYTMFESQIK